MKTFAPFIILGCLLIGAVPFAQAATPTSDWPSLNYDAAQSNNNRVEKTLTVHNVLKLKVRWTALLADQSYPVVAGNRVFIPTLTHTTVHARALDIGTGKPVATYFKDALGGMLVNDGNLYLAGKALREVDPVSGLQLAHVVAIPASKGSVFVNPVADQKVLLVGYVSASRTVSTSLYAIDPLTNEIVRKLPSTSALGAIGANRILTGTTASSTFYNESTGRKMASQPYVGSNPFAGSKLSYMVASVGRLKAGVYAFDGFGRRVWSRTIGPLLATQGADWPHAISDDTLYIQTFKPAEGVSALDPVTGNVLWTSHILAIQRMALANGVLYVLTYGLRQPVRVIALNAANGKSLGAIVLSDGYFAFNAPNGLVVADGMVFIRAIGPGGSQLIALGLPPTH